ncbi:MAG: SDR family oxidoreductase [Planctomycetales bacterium]|nr:SDR family oxidoreductase [Planctomycetales bacterium]
MTLENKVALVTGAGRGIGKGCALEIARCGADLVINDRPGSPDVDDTANEIRALGRDCTIIEGDVFSREGCEALVSQAIARAGRIDILVSNPAKSVRCSFLDYDPQLFESTIAGTLESGFHMSQLVARHLVERNEGGKILFISSVQAQMHFADSIAYGAAKAGLNHMACTIATELSQHRINVNVIEPGWINTPGEHVTFSEEVLAKEGAELPWGRLGTPEDIGRAAAFLVSGDADYITGAILPVDGGFRFKDLRSNSLISTKSKSNGCAL